MLEPTAVALELLTPAELARMLRVDRRTVYRRCMKEGWPCLKIGAQLRFNPQEVLRWLSARKEG